MSKDRPVGLERIGVLTSYLLVGGTAVVISPFVSVTLPLVGWAILTAVLIPTFLVTQLSSSRLRRRLGRTAGVAVVVLTVAWWAPWLQGLVYSLIVTNPGGLQWLGLGLLVGGPLLLLGSSSSDRSVSIKTSSGGGELSIDDIQISMDTMGAVGVVFLSLGLIGFFFLGPVVGNLYAHEEMANRVQASATQIDQPPESVANSSRIVPKRVASNWVRNSLQYPRYTSSGGDITYINGTPHWSYSLSPDGTVNTFTRKQRGAVYVNQSSMQKDILIHDDQEFRYGQGVAITDSYRWQLLQQEYLKQYREPFVVPHEGESYLVVPYVTHSWEFRALPVPQLYAIPKFGGVKIIDQEGTIETVPAAKTESHPVLEGQNYYPYGLARYKVESMAYKNGILNTYIGHKGQIELADVPGDGNAQPFTVPTQDGPTYLLAAEPWGQANGVFQIWTMDAQTGEMRYTQFEQENALRGPRKAIESIESVPQISRLNNVRAVEPIPVVRDSTLYWQARIIPSSSARITYVAFFNADTEDVTVVETTGEVRAFLAGKDLAGNDSQPPTGKQNQTDCGLEIVAKYPDGSTKTICVPEGTSVTLREAGNRTTGTDATG